MHLVTADVHGRLPRNKEGFEYILVVCDHFTKWTSTYTMKTVTAEKTADCLLKFVTTYGIPEAGLMDQGRNFEAKTLAKVWELLDVDKKRTTAYHPQCDGITERFNMTLKSM
jgi:hypothetical protein